MEQVQRDLSAAVGWIPQAEYAAEAQRLSGGVQAAPRAAATAVPAPTRPAARPPSSNGRRTGPRPLTAILPEVFLRLGVTMVESSASGETDPT